MVRTKKANKKMMIKMKVAIDVLLFKILVAWQCLIKYI